VVESRDDKIDRLWLRTSIAAWIPVSGLVFLMFLRKEAWYGGWDAALSVLSLGLLVAAIWGAIMTLHFVSIPLRIALNLIVRQRRRKYVWETVAGALAFLCLSLAAYVYFACPLE
jgi:hypothetical protein